MFARLNAVPTGFNGRMPAFRQTVNTPNIHSVWQTRTVYGYFIFNDNFILNDIVSGITPFSFYKYFSTYNLVPGIG